MKLSYGRMKKKPMTFKRLLGVSLKEFGIMVNKVKPAWEKEQAKKQIAGRPSKLVSLEDRLMALMIYYRSYVTHEWIGYLFGLHNANICRQFKRLEPIVAKVIHIKKDRTLTPDKVLELLADVTEQPIQRPARKKARKAYYSGKKKRHTQKVELVMETSGRIVSISPSRPGREHDFRLRKSQSPLPPHAEKWVDLGYQGLQTLTPQVHLPIKRQPGQSLTPAQKAYNRQQAAKRIPIEHKFRELKVFRILADVYRNFRKKHHLRFNIIAGIINLRHGF